MSKRLQQKQYPTLLYSIVFECAWLKFFSIVLLGFILTQPVSLAFADEHEMETDETISTNDAQEAEEPQSASLPLLETPETDIETETETETAAVQTPPEISTEVLPNVGSLPPEEDEMTEPLSSPEATSSPQTEVVSVDEDTSPSNTPLPDVVDTVEASSTTSSSTTATETEEPVQPQQEESDSVTTPLPTPEQLITPPLVTLPAVEINDNNRYQFGTNECVLVGDDSYYCSKVEPSNTTSNKADVVKSDRDSSGDAEIYLSSHGTQKQITDNTQEDLSPHYDPLSNTIVWHRLVDGRYEIISYDIDTDQETVLTHNTVNDMEPTRSGAYTVWQRWVDNNWDIILFDGKHETVITQTPEHDVGPYVQGGYVIWHTANSDGGRVVGVYEIETGLMSQITNDEGGRVLNPRFVLVFDTEFENGDVLTQGYDPHTGEVMPITSIPASEAPEIPAPDPTGETRALIQNKNTTSKDDYLEPLVPQGGSATSSPNASSTSATSSLQTTDVMVATSTQGMLELTEFDLVIPPLEASSTQQNPG